MMGVGSDEIRSWLLGPPLVTGTGAQELAGPYHRCHGGYRAK